MEISKFTKKDEGFICVNCGKAVTPLGYTSRDHCPYCLCSIHVDINPGDRLNDCMGVLIPVDIINKANKGNIIVYKCQSCKKLHNNKAAKDDDFNVMLNVMNKKIYK